MNLSTAGIESGQTVASASPVIAMIDEGNALEEQGRIPEALARYEAAIQTDPRCARAYLNLFSRERWPRVAIDIVGGSIERYAGQ